MPFVALHGRTGQRIDITRDDLSIINRDDIVCPFCEKPMIPRAGGLTSRRRHFAHRFGECGAEWLDPEYRDESEAHKAGKLWIAKNYTLWISGQDMNQAAVEFEVIFETPISKRIADVCVTFPNGCCYALEMQLASITPEKLQERTDDYTRSGVDVIWFLGDHANTRPNRNWGANADVSVYVVAVQTSEDFIAPVDAPAVAA